MAQFRQTSFDLLGGSWTYHLLYLSQMTDFTARLFNDDVTAATSDSGFF